ncbi:MAG: hypothetical protein KDK12_02350 [Rhodobacteraceae bacterium]|nr:hypothetical protein [Paracoccaceae bacterium]
MFRFLVAAAFIGSPSLALAQAQYIPGVWRCILNSVPANVDVVVQMAPDFTAYAEGTWILNPTPFMNGPRIEQIRAAGRWGMGPDQGQPGATVLSLQLIPGNVPSFTLAPAWLGDPNALRSVLPDPERPGAYIETACQRLR